MTLSEWKEVSLLRFILRNLIEVLQDDMDTKYLGLKASGNLWPSHSNYGSRVKRSEC